MRLMTLAVVAGSACALSSVAQADVIFSVFREYVGAQIPANVQISNRVDYLTRGPNTVTTKITSAQVTAAIQAQNPGLGFQNSWVRLADINPGANGEFLLTTGQYNDGEYTPPRPANSPATGAVLRIQNVTGAASVVTSSSGGMINNAIGVAYDASTNTAVHVGNPGGLMTPFPFHEGLIGNNYTTGAQTKIFDEVPNLANPRPRYQAGGYIQPDPRGLARTFLVGSIQGGVNSTFTSTAGGPQLYRLTYDAGLGSGAVARVVDFTNPAETGVAEDFVDETIDRFTNGGIRGIAVVPGQNVVFVAMHDYGIWKVNLTAAGAYDLASPMTQIIAPTGLVNGQQFVIDAMDYDPYANKLVFAADNANGVSSLAGLWEINLNGTGANQLVPNVLVRGIDFIPAPGSALLLGLGGLIVSRRRRA